MAPLSPRAASQLFGPDLPGMALIDTVQRDPAALQLAQLALTQHLATFGSPSKMPANLIFPYIYTQSILKYEICIYIYILCEMKWRLEA
jgi:hypothetical protein